MTAQEAGTHRFSFGQFSLDTYIYMHERKVERLVLVVQVDDYLDVGSPGLASKFKQFLQNQFCVRSTETWTLSIMGPNLEQDETEKKKNN